MEFIKNLKGYSGSKVSLWKDKNKLYVKKIGGKNHLSCLKKLDYLKKYNFKTPQIFKVTENETIMEFINGYDMESYIKQADNKDISKLNLFLKKYFKLKTNKTIDLSKNYISKFNELKKLINYKKFKFSFDELLKKLPKKINYFPIHGDLTLGNILYKDNDFYLIDANPSEFDGLIFDFNKLRQDLDIGWFNRVNNHENVKVVLNKISFDLKKNFLLYNNDYILIFMLIRILPYAKNEFDKNFLYENINTLWR